MSISEKDLNPIKVFKINPLKTSKPPRNSPKITGNTTISINQLNFEDNYDKNHSRIFHDVEQICQEFGSMPEDKPSHLINQTFQNQHKNDFLSMTI